MTYEQVYVRSLVGGMCRETRPVESAVVDVGHALLSVAKGQGVSVAP